MHLRGMKIKCIKQAVRQTLRALSGSESVLRLADQRVRRKLEMRTKEVI